MKMLFTLCFSVLAISCMGQHYKLIGDSCMRCDYSYSTGGTILVPTFFTFYPDDTITINDYVYSKSGYLTSNFPDLIVGFRQEQNKLIGLKQGQEHLIMDFGASIGDTLHGLYSNDYVYDARVDAFDSIMLLDGSYHHYMTLTGFKLGQLNGSDTNWVDQNQFISWEIVWNEQGLCGFNSVGDESLGGYTFNVPLMYSGGISASYVNPKWCTPDARYAQLSHYPCTSCYINLDTDELSLNNIKLYPNPAQNEVTFEFTSDEKRTVSIFNLQGSLLKSKIISSQKYTLEIDSFLKGVYIVEVIQNSQSVIAKLMID